VNVNFVDHFDVPPTKLDETVDSGTMNAIISYPAQFGYKPRELIDGGNTKAYGAGYVKSAMMIYLQGNRVEKEESLGNKLLEGAGGTYSRRAIGDQVPGREREN
jgi:hypothetical protein